MATVDVPKTYGAILLGGLFASVLTGVVGVQVLVYYRIYTKDSMHLKGLVFLIWFLDTLHTGFIWGALWEYIISQHSILTGIDFIPWTVALTIVVTAVLTFAVHCFFAHRIFMLGKRNWFLATPIFVMATLRLISACVTTAEMLQLGQFSTFKARFTWIFTLGLALSSAVDILITICLCSLLQVSRSGGASHSVNRLIDSLILYAFETGSLTCAGTIISMICWLTMNQNLIFMGLHFVIGKLYANSLLVTLNTRQRLRHAHTGSAEVPVLYLDTRRGDQRPSNIYAPSSDVSQGSIPGKAKKLEINVQRSIQYDADSINQVNSSS